MNMENKQLSGLSKLVAVVAVLAVGIIFKYTAGIMVPLVVSVFIAFLLAPIFSMADKLKIPQGVTIIFVFIFILIIVYVFSRIVLESFAGFAEQLTGSDGYIEKLKSIYNELMEYLKEKLNVEGELFSVTESLDKIPGAVFDISKNIASNLAQAFLVLLYLIFILLERRFFPIKIRKVFKGKSLKRMIIIMEHINRDIGKYIRTKTLISVGTGILTGITLQIAGVDNALVWAVLAVFFNFIPNIGSILIVVLIEIMAVVQFYPSMNVVVVTGIVLITIQMVMGNFLDPRLQGARLNLSPLIIIVSLVIWGWLWGVLGMFLAVPLTVTIKIICVNVPRLHAIGIFMGTGKEKGESYPFWTTDINRKSKRK